MNTLRTLAAAALLSVSTVAISGVSGAQVNYQPGQPAVNAFSDSASAFTDRANLQADLARINATLNATRTFAGRFTQLNADGSTDGGNVYIAKPGRVRFEYDGPILVVADGVTIAYQDSQLETLDRGPLSATPLDFFLKNDVDLLRDTDVVGFIKTPTEWRVSSRDGSGQVEGTLTLIFDATTLAMKGWVVDDQLGVRTQTNLSDLRYNAELDPRLFVLRDEDRRKRR